MKKLAVFAVVFSAVVFGSVAYAQMGGHSMGPGMMGCPGPGTECEMMSGRGMGHEMRGVEHPMWDLMKGLNLDEQQKASISQIRSSTMKDTIRKMADLRIMQLELKELLAKEPVDMKAVEAKVKQEETLRAEMHLSHIKAMQEVRAKLTPEQKKKFVGMLADGPMMGGMGMMHEHRCGMGMMAE